MHKYLLKTYKVFLPFLKEFYSKRYYSLKNYINDFKVWLLLLLMLIETNVKISRPNPTYNHYNYSLTHFCFKNLQAKAEPFPKFPKAGTTTTVYENINNN